MKLVLFFILSLSTAVSVAQESPLHFAKAKLHSYFKRVHDYCAETAAYEEQMASTDHFQNCFKSTLAKTKFYLYDETLTNFCDKEAINKRATEHSEDDKFSYEDHFLNCYVGRVSEAIFNNPVGRTFDQIDKKIEAHVNPPHPQAEPPLVEAAER